jgi:hypothetical protein
VESFFPAIWNILHDGVIVAVEGTVPGNLRIDIEIDYLRKRIPDPGTSIQVLLVGCTRFALREYENAKFSTALTEIAAMRPEVLNASLKNGICKIDCADGTLAVVTAGGSICLDSGRPLTLEELAAVADCNWKERWDRAKTKKDV